MYGTADLMMIFRHSGFGPIVKVVRNDEYNDPLRNFVYEQIDLIQGGRNIDVQKLNFGPSYCGVWN